ncbi:MAG TPA: hypothetical protein VJP76_08135 [Candidatus Tumulicola sp.]|nr:hypothetical protein [Candidatus Tumulicola sp.]
MPVRLVRGALAAAIAALLAACSGGTPAGPTPPGAAPLVNVAVVNGEHVVHAGNQVFRFGGTHSKRAGLRSWVSPAALTQPVLYGSSYDGGFINIYPQKGSNQAPIGQLSTGLVSPQGMHVDGKHHLWVANTNAFTVVAFKRGASAPFVTLKDPNYFPLQVAVNSQGTVYASNAESTTGPPGNVTVWAKGHTKPTATLTYGNFLIVLGVGVDASDNVFVSYIPTSGPPAMVEFPAGSQTGQPVSIQDANAGEMTFDSAGNLVMETLQNTLGVWAPPYDSSPARTLQAFGNEPTLNKAERKVWITYANYSTPHILGYNYKTGQLLDTISNGWNNAAIPIGIALDPPSAP